MNEEIYLKWCEELYQRTLKDTHPNDQASVTKRYKHFLKGNIKQCIDDTEADIQSYWE